MEAALARRHTVAPALADEDVGTYLGREAIVALRIFVGLVTPEIVPRYGVEEKARRQRLEGPSRTQHHVPRHVALLQGER